MRCHCPSFLARFSDNKEPYFNWTYMMPVAREISRRRYGSDQVSDFTANRWSIHLYPYTAEIPATPESPAVPMRQYKYQPRSDFQIQQHGIPQVLVEVQSKPSGEDPWRMLLQAGAVVRVVNHATRRDASNPHVLIAYYITRGFVHLDLKPNNLVAITDLLKIIDVGLFRQIGDGTVLKGYLGTRSWVAPELGAEDGPKQGFYPIPANL
ncbi:hypothetical protein BT69DRAFT_1143852 [Atractiella rhizophila]|nr:hypothetical protein BT69DRAFT_1143852 [Atractiella rhizophila]